MKWPQSRADEISSANVPPSQYSYGIETSAMNWRHEINYAYEVVLIRRLIYIPEQCKDIAVLERRNRGI